MHVKVSLRVKTTTSNGAKYDYFRLHWRDPVSGKEVTENLGLASRMKRNKAEELRFQKEMKLNDDPFGPNRTEPPKLGEYLKRYLESRETEVVSGTLELHQHTCRYLIGRFGEGRRLDAITPADARDFRTTLAAGGMAKHNKRATKSAPSLKTVDRHIREAKTIFNRAIDDGLLDVNPFEKIKSQTSDQRDWNYVDDSKIQKLIEVAKPGWKLMFGLARWAGLRREETIRLTWKQVDMENQTICIVAHSDVHGEWQPKDKALRMVPMSKRLHALLAAYRSLHAEMVIPPGEVCVTNLGRDFKTLCKRAGVAPYEKPVHTLRKSCLTDWATVVMPAVLQQWAGHSDIKTTMTYYVKVVGTEFDRITGLDSRPRADAGTKPDIPALSLPPDPPSGERPLS